MGTVVIEQLATRDHAGHRGAGPHRLAERDDVGNDTGLFVSPPPAGTPETRLDLIGDI